MRILLLVLLVAAAGAQELLDMGDGATTPVGAQEIAVEVVPASRLNLPRQPIRVEGMEQTPEQSDQTVDQSLVNEDIIEEGDRNGADTVVDEVVEDRAAELVVTTSADPPPASVDSGVPEVKKDVVVATTTAVSNNLPAAPIIKPAEGLPAAETAQPADTDKKEHESSTVLWIVMGVVVGLDVILLIAFMVVAAKRRKQEEAVTQVKLPDVSMSRPAGGWQPESQDQPAAGGPAYLV